MLSGPILEQLESRLMLDGTSGVVAGDLSAQALLSNPVEFVRADGNGFKLGDDPFYAPGTNNYYLLTYASSNGTRGHVDEVLEDSAALGLKVIRAWAFGEGASEWNAIQTTPGVYVESVFRGLDYVIYKAGQLGLKLILPFVNNWDDYGGMAQYIEWDTTYGTDPSQVASTHNDFYTDADTRLWYKNFVSEVINRTNTYTGVAYKDDPTIFAWELANEPRAGGDTSGNILQGWFTEMAAHVKSMDTNHMLTTGMEGFYNRNSNDWRYNGWEGTDFIRNHQIANIDFATVHVYPNEWNIDYNTCISWYQEHIDDARDVLHKPLLLEEFSQWPDADGGRTGRNTLYQGLFDLARQTDSAGWNFWMLAHNGYDYGRYEVHYPDADDAATIDIIMAAAAEMNARSGGPEPIVGDMDGDDDIDAADIDLLWGNFGQPGQIGPQFDLDGDGDADQDDVAVLVHTLVPTPAGVGTEFGDANLDGTIDATDLTILTSMFNQNDGGWAGGDFNGDGDADTTDLTILATNYGFLTGQGGAYSLAPSGGSQPATQATVTTFQVAGADGETDSQAATLSLADAQVDWETRTVKGIVLPTFGQVKRVWRTESGTSPALLPGLDGVNALPQEDLTVLENIRQTSLRKLRRTYRRLVRRIRRHRPAVVDSSAWADLSPLLQFTTLWRDVLSL